MKFIRKLLPNLSIAMLIGMIVLVIMDNHNPLLKFLTSRASKVYIIIMCTLCLLSLIMYLWRLNEE